MFFHAADLFLPSFKTMVAPSCCRAAFLWLWLIPFSWPAPSCMAMLSIRPWCCPGPPGTQPPRLGFSRSLGGGCAVRQPSSTAAQAAVSQGTPCGCADPHPATAAPGAACPACVHRVCQEPVFSQGLVRVRRRVTLIRTGLVPIKGSSGAAPGVHSPSSPSFPTPTSPAVVFTWW